MCTLSMQLVASNSASHYASEHSSEPISWPNDWTKQRDRAGQTEKRFKPLTDFLVGFPANFFKQVVREQGQNLQVG